MNYFKISRQKYSTNMAIGRLVTSRENDLFNFKLRFQANHQIWFCEPMSAGGAWGQCL